MSQPTVVVAGHPPLAEALAASGRFSSVVPVDTTSALAARVGELNTLPAEQLVFLFADTVSVDTDVKLPRMLDYLVSHGYPTIVLDVSGSAASLVDASPAVGLIGGRLSVNLVLGAIANLERGPVLEPVDGGHATLPFPDGTGGDPAGDAPAVPSAAPAPAPQPAADPFGAAAGQAPSSTPSGTPAQGTPAAGPFGGAPAPEPQQAAHPAPQAGPFGGAPQPEQPQAQPPVQDTPAAGPFGGAPQPEQPQAQQAGPFGATAGQAPSSAPSDAPAEDAQPAGGSPFGSGPAEDATPDVSLPFAGGPADGAGVPSGSETSPFGAAASGPAETPAGGPFGAAPQPEQPAAPQAGPFGGAPQPEQPQAQPPVQDTPAAGPFGAAPAPEPQAAPQAGPFGAAPQPEQPQPPVQGTPAAGPFGGAPAPEPQAAPQPQPQAGPFGTAPAPEAQPAPHPTAQDTPAAGPFGAAPQPAPQPEQQPAYGAGPFGAANTQQPAPSPFAASAPPEAQPTGGGIAPLDVRPQHQASQQRRGLLVAVVAPKGGVGKSGIAANLGAHAGIRLRPHGLNAITVDANLGNPDVGKYLNRLFPTIAELGRSRQQITPEAIDAATVKFPEMNFDALLGPARLDQANPQWMRGSFFRQITDVMRTMYDLVIVDTPVAELVHDLFDDFVLKSADYLIVVTAPNRATLDDTSDYLTTITAPVHTAAGRGFPREKVGYLLNRAEEDINCSIDDVRHELSDWNMVAAIIESKAWKRHANERTLVAGRRHPEINQAFDAALHAATGWDEFLNPTVSEPVEPDRGSLTSVFKRLFTRD